MRKTEVKMKTRRKIYLRDLNAQVTCPLCNGYLIDATALVDCHHVFCRACILRHLENAKTACPSCNTALYKKNKHQHQSLLRPDLQIQSFVYKVVPGLYSRETQCREDFYRTTGVRANSSCSDDSVLERERDLIDEEKSIASLVGDRTQFFGPDDSISLSLEYYQAHLDGVEEKPAAVCGTSESEGGDNKRFLQCPAAVTMNHLQKFLRMKFALSLNHKVDIIYEGEVLPMHFTLMDVAYTFKWKRLKPMRFFYRIFTPLKIQPIKIINTAVSGAEKQLQIIPAKREENAAKEHLLATLELQSRTKIPKVPEDKPKEDCVFEYEEPDKEELEKFIETRDREWAMQKKLDDMHHHTSKKKKKNKHKTSRKLHAEITNKEEELKLKLKLTPTNGHKHKHHKSNVDVASKEKLLQMRQIRHKHVTIYEPPKEWTINKVPTVQIERNEQAEQQVKKSVKSYQGPCYKPPLKALKSASIVPPSRPLPSNLEKKIANLQQRCTVEAKPKTYPLDPPSGLTVSKIEPTKRKIESGEAPIDKRPSLEITLINPNPKILKRPPPPPIPLDRIKKSYGAFSKSGISIIAKNNNNKDKCDNIGALDLSSKAVPPGKVNGFNSKEKINMSNLQMLSKVATESLNGSKSTSAPSTARPMPNLQTLKPVPPKVIPKLTEINKLSPHQIRLLNPTIRNLRPANQNQSIRNIPNPSLLIRQQNQNRLNSMQKEGGAQTATTQPAEVKPTATELIPV